MQSVYIEQQARSEVRNFRTRITDVIADIVLALVWLCTLYLGMMAIL